VILPALAWRGEYGLEGSRTGCSGERTSDRRLENSSNSGEIRGLYFSAHVARNTRVGGTCNTHGWYENFKGFCSGNWKEKTSRKTVMWTGMKLLDVELKQLRWEL